MKILALQPARIEHPGWFCELLPEVLAAASGHRVRRKLVFAMCN